MPSIWYTFFTCSGLNKKTFIKQSKILFWNQQQRLHLYYLGPVKNLPLYNITVLLMQGIQKLDQRHHFQLATFEMENKNRSDLTCWQVHASETLPNCLSSNRLPIIGHAFGPGISSNLLINSFALELVICRPVCMHCTWKFVLLHKHEKINAWSRFLVILT